MKSNQPNLALQLQARLKGIADSPTYATKKLNGSALVQAIQQITKTLKTNPVPQTRAGKNTKPIANLSNGGVLMSDGSIGGPVNNQLKALIQNTIDQTAYTPEAIESIRRTPIDLQNMGRGTLGVYGYETSPADAGISINPSVFKRIVTNAGIPAGTTRAALNKYANAKAIEVLRHEINHSLDSNMNMVDTPASGNSLGFASEMEKYRKSSPAASDTYNFVLNYHGTPKTNDLESFAQYGSSGQNVYRGPQSLSERYNKILIPMSKKINYSPLFSTDWDPNE